MLGDLCHPVLVAARSVPAAGLSVAGTIVGCGAGRLRVGVAREPAPLFSGAPPPTEVRMDDSTPAGSAVSRRGRPPVRPGSSGRGAPP